MTTTQNLPAPDAQAAGPQVRVLTDPATGRAIIALDPTAAQALLDLLDLVDTRALRKNPADAGMTDADAAAALAVHRAFGDTIGRMDR